jgi:hypothetical protein
LADADAELLSKLKEAFRKQAPEITVVRAQ